MFREEDTLYIHCPYCEAKGYTGKYIFKNYHINRKILPCNCTNTKMSFEDRVIQVVSECESRGHTFIGLSDRECNIKALHTKVIYKCKNGHYNDSTTISSFLQGTDCKFCDFESRRWNYNPSRAEEDDYLYLLKITYLGEDYYKIGKAFIVKDRLRKLQRIQGVTNIEILDQVCSTHKNVIFKEIEVHKELRKFSMKFPIDGGF